mgnify:CR=1 FL=1
MTQSEAKVNYSQGGPPTPPEYNDWQAKIANYFDFAGYKTCFRTDILA